MPYRRLVSPCEKLYAFTPHATGLAGYPPLRPGFLDEAPIGVIFDWTQDTAMGWNPTELGKKEFSILRTQGGLLVRATTEE
jgi:hypothetical protein